MPDLNHVKLAVPWQASSGAIYDLNHVKLAVPWQASSGAIRRALAKLEGGVCCMCGVDCRTLVAQLQSIRHGSKAWRERRLALIAQQFPK